jgi:hypothetical protein
MRVRKRERERKPDTAIFILFLLRQVLYSCPLPSPIDNNNTTITSIHNVNYYSSFLYQKRQRTQMQLISSYLSINDPNLSLSLMRQLTTVLNCFQCPAFCFLSIIPRLFSLIIKILNRQTIHLSY